MKNEETSNKKIREEMARQLGKLGGKASAKSRFAGKTKEEISEIMRKVRLTKTERAEFEEGTEDMVSNLNKNVSKN